MAKPSNDVGVPQTLLTVADVAKVLAVCTKTVRRLIDAGELPCVRIGNSIRVSPSDLNSHIAYCRIG
jgi:excisionase family DNA binding protein